MNSSYALSAWLFARALSLIYVVAFLSLTTQTRGLWGASGVSPVGNYLGAVERSTDGLRFLQVPTIFWLSSSDSMLIGAAWAGVLAAVLALFGIAQGWMLFVCYLLYLSFASAGQEFLSFQWDALLLEAGFLALFAVSWSPGFTLLSAAEPPWTVRWMFYMVLFKLMFLSGVVKLASGDPAWRDLSALSYHFWTQPLPNPLSPFMHAMPLWVHRLSTFMTFAIELPLPFLVFWPRARWIAAAGFTLLSMFIFSTGNYTFFNLLTMALCLWLIPDAWWNGIVERLAWVPQVATASTPSLFTSLVCTVLAIISVYWSTRWFLPSAVGRALQPVVRYTQIFYLSNPYGLFAVMTKTRPEIVIEGSNDGQSWKEYEFKFKPGPVNRAPPVIAPFQPRLDWQMWFAALGSFRSNPWVSNLLSRLFEGSPEVLKFFSHNPFPGEPPRFLRARMYEYEFASPSEIWTHGTWWKRRAADDYSPTFQRQ